MRALLAGLVALVFAVAASARSPVALDVPLRFNPFVAPELEEVADEPAYGSPSRWRPVLKATLVASEGSLANLGGAVLEVGEEAHGYRLREVRRWEAVFERNGATLVLPVETLEGKKDR